MKTSEIKQEIDSGLIEDIEESYNEFTNVIDLSDKDQIINDTKNYIKKIDNDKSGDHIQQIIDKSVRLIEQLEQQSPPEDQCQKYILAAFKYLIDPWDIIPDLIDGKGLLDDLYVLQLAKKRLKSDVEKVSTKEFQETDADEILEKYGDKGAELAEKARGEIVLTPNERKGLIVISQQYKNGENISQKEKIFYKTLIKKIIS